MTLKKGKSVYVVAIGGTGMSALAGMLKTSGFDVSGSDKGLYYPTSELIRELSIPVKIGYSKENIPEEVDFAVIGNAVSRDNPDAVELKRREIPCFSFPETLWNNFIKGKKSVVAAGTHGKTTTSSALAYLLNELGEDAGFMIGGVPVDFGKNYRIGSGNCFVSEGDEYDTAFFDKGPKFLHYYPDYLLLNDIEFDHADIYRDLEHILSNFSKLIDLIPANGAIAAFGDSENVKRVLSGAKCPVITYGYDDSNDWIIKDIDEKKGRVSVVMKEEGEIAFNTKLMGKHNYANLTGAIAVIRLMGLDLKNACEKVSGFSGVKRRQELFGVKNDIEIYDDFAHHPTAVRKTLEGFRARFTGKRIIAVFEPRSNSSRRNIFEKEYSEAFDSADISILAEPFNKDVLDEKTRFSSQNVVKSLQNRGKDAHFIENADSIVKYICEIVKTGDIVIVMSNGDFGNLHKKLMENI